MTRENFKLLASKGLLLDGATGTELIKLGMPSGVSPELWVYEHPEAINAVHDAYFNSGSDIVCLPNRLIIHFLGVQEIDAISG